MTDPRDRRGATGEGRAGTGGRRSPLVHPPGARPAATAGVYGFAISGRHFYVWDEDPREAWTWGGELASSDGPLSREGD